MSIAPFPHRARFCRMASASASFIMLSRRSTQ
jgi:hypothetical protein